MIREENQDGFTVLEPSEASSDKGVLLVIADGMGGLAGGATASRIAIEAIRKSYQEAGRDVRPADALKAAVARANNLIHAHAVGLPEHEPMGSTVTALAIIDSYACIGHVGDSRAYRIPPSGPIRRLTKDHTWVEELAKRGELDPSSLQYSLHRNVLTRGLGLREEVEVDVVEVEDVVVGDFFLLCSDGLHEMVEDVEIETRLRARGADIRAAVADLIELARDRGGPDNITVVVARVEAGGAPEAAASQYRGEDPGEGGSVSSAAREGIFPRSGFIYLSWFVAFALGVGAVLLLEEIPRHEEASGPPGGPIERILADPQNQELFETPEGARLREALSQYLHTTRGHPKPGTGN
jgi:protein phosphatase